MHVFSCEFCEILRPPLVAVSVGYFQDETNYLTSKSENRFFQMKSVISFSDLLPLPVRQIITTYTIGNSFEVFPVKISGHHIYQAVLMDPSHRNLKKGFSE